MTYRDHLLAGLGVLLPPAVLLVAALGAAVMNRLRPGDGRAARARAVGGLILALAAELGLLIALRGGRSEWLAAQGDASIDRFGILTSTLVLLVGLATVTLLPVPAARVRPHVGTYWAALLALIAGAVVVCNSRALPALYAGTELLGIAALVVGGLEKRRHRAGRLPLRLLVVMGLGSALALYGLALIVALTGHVEVASLAHSLRDGPLAAVAATLVIGGFVLKLVATATVGWGGERASGLAGATAGPVLTITTVAAYAFLARLMGSLPPPTQVPVAGALAVLATVMMVYGGLRALRAASLAESAGALGISAGGLLLVALVGARPQAGGIAAGVLEAVSLATGLLALGAVRLVGEDTGDRPLLLHGLGSRSPADALLVMFGVATLAGVPPLLGAVSRATIVEGALLSGFGWLAVAVVFGWLLVLAAAVRVAVLLYTNDERADHDGRLFRRGVDPGTGLVGVILALPLLLQPLSSSAADAAAAVLR